MGSPAGEVCLKDGSSGPSCVCSAWVDPIGLVEQDLEQDLDRYSCMARCNCDSLGPPEGEAFCVIGGPDDLGIGLGLGSDEPRLMAVRRSARSAEGCLESPETEVGGEAFDLSMGGTRTSVGSLWFSGPDIVASIVFATTFASGE